MAASRGLRRSGFLRDVALLSVGGIGGQCLLLLATPLLSRLYLPEQFGVSRLFGAWVAVLSIVVGLGFERMILVADSHEDLRGLERLVSVCCLPAIVFATAVAWWSRHALADWLDEPRFEFWSAWIPGAAALVTLSLSARYAMIREGAFRSAGITEGLAACTQIVCSALLGWLRPSFLPPELGLILGSILGRLVAPATRFWMKGFSRREVGPPASAFRSLLSRYGRLSATLASTQLTGRLAQELPGLIVQDRYGGVELGYYTLAQRLSDAPVTFFALPVGDVFRQRALRQRQTAGKFDGLYLRTLLLMMTVGIPSFLAAILFAPGLITFILGDPWAPAGPQAQALLIGSLAAFVFIPTEKTAQVTHAKLFLALGQVGRLAGTGVAIWSAYAGDLTTLQFLWLLSAIRSLQLAVGGCVAYFLARSSP